MTVWTTPGSPRHCELCEAFLEWGGYIVMRDALHEVVSMETRYDLDGRTCWRLSAAVCAGAA